MNIDDDSDYFALPDYGVGYFNLPDAALLGALDMWSQGLINPDLPAPTTKRGNIIDQLAFPEWMREGDTPSIRQAIRPKQRQILESLIRSVAANSLTAHVQLRDLSTSDAVPERTYVNLTDFVNWLSLHGYEGSFYLLVIQNQEYARIPRSEISSSIAAARSCLRAGEPIAEPQNGLDIGDEKTLRRAVHQLTMQNQKLRQELEAKPERRSASAETKKRRTYLTLIAALCHKAGIDLHKHGAGAMLASATQEFGIPVGDDTTRTVIAEIGNEVENPDR
jgi:hypothetical protein